MEATGSIFVRLLSQQSLCLKVGPLHTINDIKHLVQERTGFPVGEQLLCPPRELQNSANSSLRLCDLGNWKDSTFQLSGRLRGGKGGFGSLLRGSAKTAVTDNEDACRDLSGRRLRVVNAEKKLQEWQAGEKGRKSQIQAAKEEKERQRAEKRAEITQAHLDDIRKDESAVTQSLARAIASAQTAGQKRPAEKTLAKPAKKKMFRGASDDDDSEVSEDDSESNPEELLPKDQQVSKDAEATGLHGAREDGADKAAPVLDAVDSQEGIAPIPYKGLAVS